MKKSIIKKLNKKAARSKKIARVRNLERVRSTIVQGTMKRRNIIETREHRSRTGILQRLKDAVTK